MTNILLRIINTIISRLDKYRNRLSPPKETPVPVKPPIRASMVGTRGWFTYNRTNLEMLEGIVYSDNNLGLRISYGKEWISIKVSPESADKLTGWLLKYYPPKGGSSGPTGKTTKKLARLVSLPGGKANSGSGTKPPRGKLE